MASINGLTKLIVSTTATFLTCQALAVAETKTCKTAKDPVKCDDVFKSLTSESKDFYLGHTGVQEVYSEDLNGQVYNNVTSVTLSRPEDKNSLVKVSGDFFSHFPAVETITIWKSGLKELPHALFQNLPKLKSVNLMQSHLEILYQDQFVGSPAIEFLGIDHNNLKKIEAGVFDGLINLTHLELDSNHETDDEPLAELPEGLFAHNKNLQELDIDCNGIDHLPPGLFDGLTKLCSIDMKGNHIADFSDDLFKDQPSKDDCKKNGRYYSRELLGNPGYDHQVYMGCMMLWDNDTNNWITKRAWKDKN